MGLWYTYVVILCDFNVEAKFAFKLLNFDHNNHQERKIRKINHSIYIGLLIPIINKTNII